MVKKCISYLLVLTFLNVITLSNHASEARSDKGGGSGELADLFDDDDSDNKSETWTKVGIGVGAGAIIGGIVWGVFHFAKKSKEKALLEKSPSSKTAYNSTAQEKTHSMFKDNPIMPTENGFAIKLK